MTRNLLGSLPVEKRLAGLEPEQLEALPDLVAKRTKY